MPRAAHVHRTNVSWSMDFVADGSADGRRLRCLTIVDDCTRESLVLEVDTSLPGLRVISVLDRLAESQATAPRVLGVERPLSWQWGVR